MSAHELDHLAIAVPSWAPAGEVLNRELGAQWASGFRMPAFNPCQLVVADDMRVELLEPGGAEDSFIQRYLTENHERTAPHHITFKVRDIREAMATAQRGGVEPVLVNLEYSQWQEAFLHPKDTGLGFLVQMVETSDSIEEMTGGIPSSAEVCPWEQPNVHPVRVQVIHGRVADLSSASHVLVDILGADEFRVDPEHVGSARTGHGWTGRIRGFHWDEGADLLLSEADGGPSDTQRGGIDALGFLPVTESWRPGEYPADVADRLREGTVHRELGIRVAALAGVRASAGTLRSPLADRL